MDMIILALSCVLITVGLGLRKRHTSLMENSFDVLYEDSKFKALFLALDLIFVVLGFSILIWAYFNITWYIVLLTTAAIYIGFSPLCKMIPLKESASLATTVVIQLGYIASAAYFWLVFYTPAAQTTSIPDLIAGNLNFVLLAGCFLAIGAMVTSGNLKESTTTTVTSSRLGLVGVFLTFVWTILNITWYIAIPVFIVGLLVSAVIITIIFKKLLEKLNYPKGIYYLCVSLSIALPVVLFALTYF